MFDDIPITNPTRDREWEKWIKRKTVVAFMKDKKDFNFPLDGSYEVWCAAWEKAWHAGFKSGYRSGKD